ncbi:hypothetical protein BJ322DRAFT_1007972 [Thelephora terrestris]|uniref:Bromo domain-containing protein n=1 Tax=Thelephora terrestris TaxID=56493 RepID=A0A9P6HC33_9AGAM|nr:hypothetical protein BJ322DRAFT_1007972 [Thelephora terrestris]
MNVRAFHPVSPPFFDFIAYQNLLRTLTEGQVKASLADTDLKLLLSTVKDGRLQSQDAKLSDAFYESLEGLLNDLRTVTLDNHDAEAFLKPVSKSDVPDYYEVISTPMDFQTMLKRVKTRTYKSKREFEDDLDLIWSNCMTYNALPDHPLRQCAKRLRVKAERLLKNITDRKDRSNPPIPSDLPGRTPSTILIKPNGINGHSRSQSGTPVPSLFPPKSTIRIPPSTLSKKKKSKDISFPESPAIIRTAEGMRLFKAADEELDDEESNVENRLREFTLEDPDEFVDLESEEETALTGDKRKTNGTSAERPRKRSRRSSSSAGKQRVDLWWEVMQCDQFVGSGYPALRYSSSNPDGPPPFATAAQAHVQTLQTSNPRRKRRKKVPKEDSHAANKTLLGLINKNITTVRHLRVTHSKFSSLKESKEAANDEGGLALPGTSAAFEPLSNINPWSRRLDEDRDFSPREAENCLHWVGEKVLEHAGFQGTSKIALDVLTGVASEYLSNVGRTIQFLSEKYGKKMSPEEVILHTLFESGITRVGDLERYIQDDVVRYGGRLSELGKKLDNAYQEITNEGGFLDDDALFGDEIEGDENPFVMGGFADMVGEDFLGLRGIASELGISSLSVPKKLLRPKGGRMGAGSSLPKPTEPPPPFPPPPLFVPLEFTRMEDEIIGLLRPFYKSRFEALAQAQATPSKPQPPIGIENPPTTQATTGIPGQLLQSSFSFPTLPHPTVQQPSQSQLLAVLVLQDDVPTPAQTKMGPLGQIAGGKSTNAAAKKKQKKEKDPTSSGTGGGGGGVPGVVSGLVGGGMNGVINMNVGTGGGIQQMTVAGSQPGSIGGTIGVMQASTMTQTGAPGQTSTTGEAQTVPMKKRGGPGRGKKGKMDLASRVVVATAS